MRYDCHVHASDPHQWRPAHAARQRIATADELRANLGARGVQRAVLVQPRSCSRAQASFLEALRGMGEQARGVALASPYLPTEELDQWTHCGVRGVWLEAQPDGWDTLDEVTALDAQLPRDWSIELAGDPATLARCATLLARSSRLFVCIVPPNAPKWDKEVQRRLLWWGEMGNLYFKLVTPAASATASGALVFPMADRLLWGSGSPLSEGHAATCWAPLVETFERNACSLYGFDPV